MDEDNQAPVPDYFGIANFLATSSDVINTRPIKELLTLDNVNILKYISRKNGLPRKWCDTVVAFLCTRPSNLNTRHTDVNSISWEIFTKLAQVLKYCVRKDLEAISGVQFIDLLQNCALTESDPGTNKIILNEICAALAIHIDHESCNRGSYQGILSNKKLQDILKQKVPFLPLNIRLKIELWISLVEAVANTENWNKSNGDSSPSSSSSSSFIPQDPSVRLGQDILADVGGSKVNKNDGPGRMQAHAVKTQQVLVHHNNEFNSEKIKIQQVNLVNALTRSVLQNVDFLKAQVKKLQSLKSKVDMEMVWYRTTGHYIAQFLKNVKGNKDKHDKDKYIISDNNLRWLSANFECRTRKFGWLESDFGMIKNIAEIFSIISEFQEIPSQPSHIVLILAKELFQNINVNTFGRDGFHEVMVSTRIRDRSKVDPWEDVRKNIITTIENHALRHHGYISEELVHILDTFQNSSECTDQMKGVITQIKSNLPTVDTSNDVGELSLLFLKMCNMLKSGPTNDIRETAIEFVGKYIVQKNHCKQIIERCSLNSEPNQFSTLFANFILDPQQALPLRVKVAKILEMFLAHSFTIPLDISIVEHLSMFVSLVCAKSLSQCEVDNCDEENAKLLADKRAVEEANSSTILKLFLKAYHFPLPFANQAGRTQNLPERANQDAVDKETSKNESLEILKQCTELKSSVIRSILHCLTKQGKISQDLYNVEHLRFANIFDLLINLSIANTYTSDSSAATATDPLPEIPKDLQVCIVSSLETILSQNPGIFIPSCYLLASKLSEKHLIYPNATVVLHDEGNDQISNETNGGPSNSSNAGLQGENPNIADSEATYVSAIVAKLLLQQIKFLNPSDFQYFLYVQPLVFKCLKSHPDKTTRILCAEYVFLALACIDGKCSVFPLDNENLALLRELSKDAVVDLKVFCTAAYCLGLKHFVCSTSFSSTRSRGNTTGNSVELEGHEIDALAYMYVWENLILDGRDYKECINSSILEILDTVSNRTALEFSEDIFLLLNLVLTKECATNDIETDIVCMILKIFISYTETRTGHTNTESCSFFNFPISSRDAVDSIYAQDDRSSSELCELIYLNMLLTGRQSLSEQCLESVSKTFGNLSFESDSLSYWSRYIRIFKIIFLADVNQDIPDYLFDQLDMELAGATLLAYFENTAGLHTVATREVHKLFNFLEEKCKFWKQTPSVESASEALNAVCVNVERGNFRYFKMSSIVWQGVNSSLQFSLFRLTALKLVTTAVGNGQSVPKETVDVAFGIVEKLSTQNLENCQVIQRLCTAVLERNLNFPHSLFQFVCTGFTFIDLNAVTRSSQHDQEIRSCWLQVIAELGNHQFLLPFPVVQKLCEHFFDEAYSDFRYKILHALVRLFRNSSTSNCLRSNVRCYGEFKQVCLAAIFTDPVNKLGGSVVPSSKSTSSFSSIHLAELAISGLKMLHESTVPFSLSPSEQQHFKNVFNNSNLSEEATMQLQIVLSDSYPQTASVIQGFKKQFESCTGKNGDNRFLGVLSDFFKACKGLPPQEYWVSRLVKIVNQNNTIEAAPSLQNRALDFVLQLTLNPAFTVPVNILNAVGLALVNSNDVSTANFCVLILESTVHIFNNASGNSRIFSDRLFGYLQSSTRSDVQKLLCFVYNSGLPSPSFQPSEQLVKQWEMNELLAKLQGQDRNFGGEEIQSVLDFLSTQNSTGKIPDSAVLKSLLKLDTPTLKDVPNIDLYLSHLLLRHELVPKYELDPNRTVVLHTEKVVLIVDIISQSIVTSQKELCCPQNRGQGSSITPKNSSHILYIAYKNYLKYLYTSAPASALSTQLILSSMTAVLKHFKSPGFHTEKRIQSILRDILSCLSDATAMENSDFATWKTVEKPNLIDIFEGYLSSGSPRLRSLAFRCLRNLPYPERSFELMIENMYSKVLNNFGENSLVSTPIVNRSSKNFNLKLINVLVSLSFWDLKEGQFALLEKTNWIRYLIASDIVASYFPDSNAKISKVAEVVSLVLAQFTFDEAIEIYNVIKFSVPSNSTPVAEIVDILRITCELEFSEVVHILEEKKSFKEGGNTVEILVLPYKDQLLELVNYKILQSKFPEDVSISPEVLKLLLSNLTEAIGIEYVRDLLNMLSAIDSVASIENLAGVFPYFRSRAKIQLICKQHSTPSRNCVELIKLFQCQYLLTFWPGTYARIDYVERYLGQLISLEFPFDTIKRLFEALQLKSDTSPSPSPRDVTNEEDWIVAENIVCQIINYRVSLPLLSQIVEAIQSNSGGRQLQQNQDPVRIVNSLIMTSKFERGASKKAIREFVEDFHRINKINGLTVTGSNESVSFLKLETLIERIELGNERSHLLTQNPKNICDWGKDDIMTWASSVKLVESRLFNQTKDKHHTEFLMVVRRACFLVHNYNITFVQIMSCILALSFDIGLSSSSKGQDRGQLHQVVTGCGKSTIIAILAVANALKGRKVDIYTSSAVLAERDARKWSSFYDMFAVTCDHNGDRNQLYLSGLKKCYKSHIVYGETSNFQFDTLRDEYSGLGTRGGRSFDFALIDEVDTMLIDDSAKLARLSTTLPGMDTIQIMYHLIWDQLLYLQKHLFSVRGLTFFLRGQILQLKSGRYLYRVATEDEDGDEKLCEIPDFVNFLFEEGNSDKEKEAGISRVDKIYTFIKSSLISYAQNLIQIKSGETTAAEPRVAIPKNLLGFVQVQIPKWIDSALTAFSYRENANYIVDDGHIKPVDFQTTGLVQDSTSWTNGLHQFLQLKHSLKITSESVTTNFLSNSAMLQKYKGQNIIGLTGTLGSEYCRNILQNSYPVNVYLIPENHFKNFYRFPDLILHSVSSWRDEIVNAASHEAAKGRGVLVIVETISQAHLISKMLKQFHILAKLYTRNNANQEKLVERIHGGDVIVATNLAGRGTDIQASNINSSGGLHVILTFLSASTRVEEQAFGRTARQGHRGTGQLITYVPSASNSNLTVESSTLLEIRQTLEVAALNSFETSLSAIQTNDTIFTRFCKLFGTLRSQLIENRHKKSLLNKVGNAVELAYSIPVKGVVQKLQSKTLNETENIVLLSLEELWAMFLVNLENVDIDANTKPLTKIQKYQHFEENIYIKCASIFEGNEYNIDTEDGTASLPCKSAFYYCQLGNLEFVANSKLYPRLEMAEKYYKKALKFDSKFAAPAYIGRGNILLTGHDPFLMTKQFKDGYKVKALKFLKNGLILLCNEMASLTAVQSLLYNRNRDTKNSECSDLHFQLLAKMNYFGTYTQTVNGNMKAIQKSLRQVMCHEFSQDGVCTNEGILKGRSLTGFCTASPGHVKNEHYYSLNFHDLTRHKDLWEQDQAVKTIRSSTEILTKCGNSTAKMSLTCTSLTSLGQLKIPVHSEKYQNSGALFKIKYANLNLAEVEELLSTFKSYGLTQSKGFTLLPMTPQNSNLTLGEVLEQLGAYKASEGFNAREFYDLIVKDVIPGNVCLIQKQTHSGTVSLSEMSLSNCKVELYNVSAKNLTEFVKIFRDCGIRFSLNISNLSEDLANKILAQAYMDQENIQLLQSKDLTELQMTSYAPLVELLDLKARGILFLVSFIERPFIPWWTVASIGVLAGAQIVVGTCLMCTVVGSTFGMGLITEGAVDAFTAARLTSTREFNMKEFITKKGVSIAISCVSMGYSAYSKGVSGATTTVAQGVINEAGEQAVTQGLTKSGRIYQAGRAGLSAAWKSRLKKTATLVGGVGICVGVNTSIDLLAKFAFAQVRDKIRSQIEFHWLDSFSHKLYVVFKEQWARDKLSKKRCLNDKVLPIVHKLTGGTYKCQELTQMWMKFANLLCNQVREYSEKTATFVSLVAIVGVYISKLNEVRTITDTISEVILWKLSPPQQRASAAPNKLLQVIQTVSSRDIARIVQFVAQSVQSGSHSSAKRPANAKTAAPGNAMSSENMEKLKRFESQFNLELPEIRDLNRLIIDLITDHLISLADGELCSPFRAPGTQSFVNQLCPGFQLEDDLLLSELGNIDVITAGEASLFGDCRQNRGRISAAAENDFDPGNRRERPAEAQPSLLLLWHCREL